MKLQRRLMLLLISCSSVLLFGCPYSSTVPISNSIVMPNPKLKGKWLGDDNKTYNVSIAEDRYDLWVDGTADGNPRHYKGYFTIINGTTFLNLYEDGKAPVKYDIYELEFPDRNTIVVREMSEDIDRKFATPDELRAYISKNMYSDTFHKPGDGPLTLERL